MIYAGCDVGSLTAEAVIIRDKKIIAGEIIQVRAGASASARQVMEKALEKAGLGYNDISLCYSTGYGRFSMDFAEKNISEISCHGMGAHYVDSSIRTIIDIGGQDCKVIAIDKEGLVLDFVMNDKCAAGTGRSLEILANAIDVDLDKLGPVSMKSKRPVRINNKCGIFMEQEVLWNLYKNKKIKDLALGINQAVAKRVAILAKKMKIRPGIALTGGVSKNIGVKAALEDILNINFTKLSLDPQLMGALGAAIYAMKEYK